jgi:hypothetical protein
VHLTGTIVYRRLCCRHSNVAIKAETIRPATVGSTYCFEEFTAHGLTQALGYVEGYDHAMNRDVPSSAAYEADRLKRESDVS